MLTKGFKRRNKNHRKLIMRAAALITTAAALSVASAFQLGLDDLWTKPGALKVMEYCVGENVTQQYLKQAQATMDKCHNASSFENFELTVSSMEISNWDKLFHDFAVNTTVGGDTKSDQYAPLVEAMKCVFEGLELTHENGSINFEGVKKGYNSMDLPDTLKTELLAGVEQCYELAQCFPEDKSSNSRIPKDLLQLKTFLSCELYLRNWACLKRYLKDSAPTCEIDFSGGDGILGSNSSTTTTPKSN